MVAHGTPTVGPFGKDIPPGLAAVCTYLAAGLVHSRPQTMLRLSTFPDARKGVGFRKNMES